MKKTYQKPQVQILEMKAESSVLTTSGGIPVKPGPADGSISPMSVDGGESSIWSENAFREK